MGLDERFPYWATAVACGSPLTTHAECVAKLDNCRRIDTMPGYAIAAMQIPDGVLLHRERVAVCRHEAVDTRRHLGPENRVRSRDSRRRFKSRLCRYGTRSSSK